MPLNEEDIISQGEGCPRGRYRINEEDLQAVSDKLDKIDGENPYVTYNVDSIRRTLAGGSKSSPGCIAYYLNRTIQDSQDLRDMGIYVHTDRGNIRFDRNIPSREENEEPK
jgi:hypothetical protein